MFPEISFRLNKSVMTDTFVDLSLPMIDVYGSTIPSGVTPTTEEYNKAKIESILFDVSYKRRFIISGSDSVLAMDHFISAPIRNLHIGDAIKACILDTKGYILYYCDSVYYQVFLSAFEFNDRCQMPRSHQTWIKKFQDKSLFIIRNTHQQYLNSSNLKMTST